MSHAPHDDRERLLPAGHRWGKGAGSIIPYLYVQLLVRPLSGREGDDDSIRNPVFPHMDRTLRMLRRGH